MWRRSLALRTDRTPSTHYRLPGSSPTIQNVWMDGKSDRAFQVENGSPLLSNVNITGSFTRAVITAASSTVEVHPRSSNDLSLSLSLSRRLTHAYDSWWTRCSRAFNPFW